MCFEKVNNFYQALINSDYFNEELKNKLQRIHDEKEYKVFIQNELLPLAKSMGYDLSVDDILSYEHQKLQQLSEEELESVTGGMGIMKKLTTAFISALALAGSAYAMQAMNSMQAMQATTSTQEQGDQEAQDLQKAIAASLETKQTIPDIDTPGDWERNKDFLNEYENKAEVKTTYQKIFKECIMLNDLQPEERTSIYNELSLKERILLYNFCMTPPSGINLTELGLTIPDYILNDKDVKTAIHSTTSSSDTKPAPAAAASAGSTAKQPADTSSSQAAKTAEPKITTTSATDIGAFKDYVGKHFQIQCKHEQGLVIGFNDASKELCLVPIGDPRGQWIVDRDGLIASAQNSRLIICTENLSNYTRPRLVNKSEVKDQTLATWSLNQKGEIVSTKDPNRMLNVLSFKLVNDQPIIVWGRQDDQAKNDKWTLIPNTGVFANWAGKSFQIQCKHEQGLVIGFNDASKELCLVPIGDPRGQWIVDRDGLIASAQNSRLIICTENLSNYTRPRLVNKSEVKDQTLATWSLNQKGEIVSTKDPNRMLNVLSFKLVNDQPIIMWGKQGDTFTNDKWTLSPYLTKEQINEINEIDDIPTLIASIQSLNETIDTYKNKEDRESVESLAKYTQLKTDYFNRLFEIPGSISKLNKIIFTDTGTDIFFDTYGDENGDLIKNLIDLDRSLVQKNPLKVTLYENTTPATFDHGIVNYGNSCYLNAALQQLYRNTHFRKFFANRETLSSLKEPNSRLIYKYLSEIFTTLDDNAGSPQIEEDKNGWINFGILINKLRYFYTVPHDNNLNAPMDAHEVLTQLLDEFHYTPITRYRTITYTDRTDTQKQRVLPSVQHNLITLSLTSSNPISVHNCLTREEIMSDYIGTDEQGLSEEDKKLRSEMILFAQNIKQNSDESDVAYYNRQLSELKRKYDTEGEPSRVLKLFNLSAEIHDNFKIYNYRGSEAKVLTQELYDNLKRCFPQNPGESEKVYFERLQTILREGQLFQKNAIELQEGFPKSSNESDEEYLQRLKTQLGDEKGKEAATDLQEHTSTSSPETILIHFVKMHNDGSFLPAKTLPDPTIDLSSSFGETVPKYHLAGIIPYLPGHYISFVYEGGKWVLYNDNNREEIPDFINKLQKGEKIKTRNGTEYDLQELAYILRYEQNV